MKWPVNLDDFVDEKFYSLLEIHPFVLYDIGARGGIHELFRQYSDVVKIRVYAFEPEKSACEELEKEYCDRGNIIVINKAVSERSGQEKFFVMGGASSLLVRPNVSCEAVTVECVSLDEFVKDQGNLPPNFIKIDTEGAELKGFKGASQVLQDNILGIYCEISFWKGHAGRCYFREIDEYLSDRGFILFDLTVNRAQGSGIGGKKGKVRTGDVLYLKKFDLHYREMQENNVENSFIKAQLFKLIMICCRYYYLDYAYELVRFGYSKELLDKSEFEILDNKISCITDLSQLIPNFPGKKYLSFVVDLFSYLLHRGAGKGRPDFLNGLGNRRICLVQIGRKEPKIKHPVCSSD